MLNMSDDGLYKFSDKEIRRVTQISVIEEENVIAVLAGESKKFSLNIMTGFFLRAFCTLERYS